MVEESVDELTGALGAIAASVELCAFPFNRLCRVPVDLFGGDS
jgi:hypothetical protein